MTPEQAKQLRDTVEQFTDVFNTVCRYGWDAHEKNGVKLHHATYYQMREEFPQLNANILIQARIKATEALKSAFTWVVKKEASHKKKVAKARKQGKGTKSAKRHLKKLSNKQMRFHKDCDHVLSKQIVASTPTGATIVLENLTNIRETSKMGRGKNNKNVENKRKLHSWTFAQLYGFIAYKGQERGIRVEKIDPRHTSQTCSKCGHQARNNRRSQSLFLCRKCKYSLNADYNASKNIRDKYLATSLALFGTSLESGSSSVDLSSQASA